MRSILTLALLAVIGLVAWNYLAPLMGETQADVYSSFKVERGDIATSKSFSATISVLNSESQTNSSGASSIREMYVEAGQEVEKGDKLILLDNGELLTAGIGGVVNEMRYGTGDNLRQNVQLIQICDLKNLQVSLSLDEYDVVNVSAGQPCTVTIIPLERDFDTELTHVNRVSSGSSQVAYYTATAELTAPPEVLPGMSASVTIPAETARNVLTLDLAAIAFDESKNPYVLRREGEGYARVPVTTGLTDGMKVEILSGLAEGDEVWAVTGKETVAPGFSLIDLYKQYVGETVIINNMDGGNRSGRSSGSQRNSEGSGSQRSGEGSGRQRGGLGGMATPSDMPEGFQDFGGIVTPSDMPEGFSAPQMPGEQRPGQGQQPSNQERTDTP